MIAAPATPEGCATDPVGTPACGNGLREAGEACDGDDTGGETCEAVTNFEREVGTVQCTSSCQLDGSECRASVCGDGRAEGRERCDGDDLGGGACPYPGGELKCNASCEWDFSQCKRCGDGRVDENEQCDGANLNGKTCGDYSSATSIFGNTVQFIGTLGCQSDCRVDTTQCRLPPGCYWSNFQYLPTIQCI